MVSTRGTAVLFLAGALLLPWCVRAAAPSPIAQEQDDAPMGGGGFQIVEHSIRGDITAISGTTLTVKTDEGETYKVATGPNTRIRKQRDEGKFSDLHIGDMIAAVGDKDVKAHIVGAMFVVIIDKQQYEQMRGSFGKTWTAGVVQSIEGTNIVIQRADKVTQTVAVDENTEFRRRREDITLGDIKPGDHIGARGALQNGSFLATEVNVGGPNGNGNWAGRRSDGAPPPNN